MADSYLCEESPRALDCAVCKSKFLYYPKGRGRFPLLCSDGCRQSRRYEAEKQRSPRQRIDIPCAIDGCERSQMSRGWCAAHYHRWRSYGDPLAETRSERKARDRSQRQAERKQARLIQAYSFGSNTPKECLLCGKVFFRQGNGCRSDAGKYCSRECGLEWIAFRNAAKTRATFTVRKLRCHTCNGVFTPANVNRVYCSDDCRPSCAPKERQEIACQECGSLFLPESSKQVRCSRACKKAAAKRANKAWAKVSGAKSAYRKARKLRLRGVTVETVNPIKVLERDRWTCQLCGLKTPKRLRGSYDDRAPEIDHIVSLANGGVHSYANVQCACRRCNLLKSGASKSQLLLFG